MYEFKTLCFGLRNAPYAFDRLGQALRKFFQLLSIRIIIYYDDLLVLAQGCAKCIKDAQFVIDTLVKLGFRIKIEKCILSPSQRFFFLGFIWDTINMECVLPEEKLANIHALCQKIEPKKHVTVQLVQRLLGTIMASRPAVPLTRARSRGIQRTVLDHYDGTKKSARKLIRMSDWATNEVEWWLNLKTEDCRMSLKLLPVWESERLATDAMDLAIGSIFRGIPMYQQLEPFEIHHTIAHKEWMAFERRIRMNLHQIRDCLISWHVDNKNVLHAWLNSGSIRDKWICKRIVDLQILLQSQNTKIVPVYVRSAQHLHADLISRNKILPDWHLQKDIAQKLFMRLGVPEIDLMATSKSRQLPKFYSAVIDQEAEAIDALTQNWNLFKLAYVFHLQQ